MRLTVFAAATVLYAGTAAAAPDDIERGPLPGWAVPPEPLPVPDDARGPLFVRRALVETHLDRTGQTTLNATQIRILDATALPLGNVAFSWNPAAGKPVVHALRVHRAGEVRDVLDTTKFEILRREDKLETAMLDGSMTATLRVPDLRVGDDLEVTFSLPTQDPTLGPLNSGVLLFAPTPPPGRFALRLSWEPGTQPTVRPTEDLARSAVRGKQSIGVSFDNPAALAPPKDAPGRFNWLRAIEYSDFADWTAVSARVAPLFAKASGLSAASPVRAEIKTIAAASSDPLIRANAALTLVQQQVRYVYVGLNGGNLTPATAEETWERRYGDCKGKTALLLAMLHELGIEAQPVLVSNMQADDGFDQRLPSPSGFDHVLVQAKIAGRTYWLDGTLPAPYRASENPVIPYKWVLPVTAAGSNLVNLPWTPFTQPEEITLFELDAREGFDKPAKIRNVSITRGVRGLTAYYQFSGISDSQLQSAVRQNLEGGGTWNAVDRVAWRFDAKEGASILEITGTGPLDWDDDDDVGKSLALPGGGFSPPARRQRGSSADATVPYAITPDFDCNVTTLRLPAATTESDWSYNTSYETEIYGQTFRRSFERRDATIRMIRANRTTQTELPAKVAAQDTLRLAKFDNSMAWARFKQGELDASDRTERVRATFEGDWVADASPCLARAFIKP